MGSGLNETMYGGTDGTKLTPKANELKNRYKDVTTLSCSWMDTAEVYWDNNSSAQRVALFLGSQTDFNTLATAEGTYSDSTKTLTGSQHYVNFGNSLYHAQGSLSANAWSGSRNFVDDDDATVVFRYRKFQ